MWGLIIHFITYKLPKQRFFRPNIWFCTNLVRLVHWELSLSFLPSPDSWLFLHTHLVKWYKIKSCFLSYLLIVNICFTLNWLYFEVNVPRYRSRVFPEFERRRNTETENILPTYRKASVVRRPCHPWCKINVLKKQSFAQPLNKEIK